MGKASSMSESSALTAVGCAVTLWLRRKKEEARAGMGDKMVQLVGKRTGK